MQNELKTLQEFRKKKVEMQSEIDRLEKALGDVSYQHKVELGDVEQKFFEEKVIHMCVCVVCVHVCMYIWVCLCVYCLCVRICACLCIYSTFLSINVDV